jgi:hypothetical protein
MEQRLQSYLRTTGGERKSERGMKISQLLKLIISAVGYHENTCVAVDALAGAFDADDAGGRAKYRAKLGLLAASIEDGDTTCGP